MKQQKQDLPTTKKKDKESLSYLVEVRDKKGRVLQRISAPSRSFVQQWNQLINLQARQTNSTLRLTDGTTFSIAVGAGNLIIKAAIGVTTYGFRVGKGFTPVAIDDFALETPLAEGVGVDEFNHQLCDFSSAPAVVGGTSSFGLRRIFVNNSGATISGIREIGAYMRMAAKFGLAWRDVLPGGVTVPDGGSITVTYTLAATV